MTARAVPLTGLYTKIRHLKQVGPDEFRAYSAEGALLVELDKEGAEVILASDPYRVSVSYLTYLKTPDST